MSEETHEKKKKKSLLSYIGLGKKDKDAKPKTKVREWTDAIIFQALKE